MVQKYFLTVRPEFKKGDVIAKDIKGLNKTFKSGTKITNPKEINEALTCTLAVIGDVSVEKRFKVTETQVHKNTNNFAPFIFHDSGSGDYSFTVNVAMKNKTIHNWIDYFYVRSIPLNITVDTAYLLNGLYKIVEASNRKIIRRGYSEWEIKFTAYFDVTTTKKYVNNQKKVDKLTSQVSNCTLKKWKTKTKITTLSSKDGKTKVKVKRDYNDCNKIITKILYKKGFLKKKYVGKNWDVFYLKTVKKSETKSKLRDTEGNYATLVEKNKIVTVYPCKKALKKFQKKWNKKKLKPYLKENGKKDKKTLKALKRYKEL